MESVQFGEKQPPAEEPQSTIAERDRVAAFAMVAAAAFPVFGQNPAAVVAPPQVARFLVGMCLVAARK